MGAKRKEYDIGGNCGRKEITRKTKMWVGE
jgi:hypothetical protein